MKKEQKQLAEIKSILNDINNFNKLEDIEAVFDENPMTITTIKKEKVNKVLLDKDHQKEILLHKKLDFYECAMLFFKENDLLEMIETVKAENPSLSTGLGKLWVRHHAHINDLKEFKEKVEQAGSYHRS